MLRLDFIIAVAVLPGSLGLAVTQGALAPKTPQSSMAVGDTCEVRRTKVPGGVELEAIVSSVRALNGSYSFVVEKSGSGGDSNIAQAGEFSLEQGAEQVLGSAGLGLARGDTYRTKLVVTNGSGDIACEAEDDRT